MHSSSLIDIKLSKLVQSGADVEWLDKTQCQKLGIEEDPPALEIIRDAMFHEYYDIQIQAYTANYALHKLENDLKYGLWNRTEHLRDALPRKYNPLLRRLIDSTGPVFLEVEEHGPI